MKMHGKKHILIIAAAAVLSLQGCIDSLRPADSDEMKIRIGARVLSGQTATKASAEYIDQDYENNLDVTLIRWDENSGTSSPVGKDEKAAVMSGSFAQDGSWERAVEPNVAEYYVNRSDAVGFMGWFPASSSVGWQKTSDGKVIDSNGKMSFTIDGTTDVMVSDFVQGNFTSGVPAMKFSHALSLFKFYVYAVDDDAKTEWGSVQSIKLTNMPEQLVITLPSDLSSGESASFAYKDGETNVERELIDSDASIELPVGTPPKDENSPGYVGCILGGPPTDGILGLRATTSEHSSGNSVSIARNFKPGYAYNVYIRFSRRGVVNAEISVSEWNYDPSKYYNVSGEARLVTNLSEYGTANSYIVSSGNRSYCFDANVKGNGVNTLSTRSGSISLPDTPGINPGEIASVRIIRSDAMMELNLTSGSMTRITERTERQEKGEKMIELLYDKPSNGRILFRVPGNPDNEDDSRLIYRGNAKIGAYDASGNLIWSWHIWITDKPINQGYSNGYVALDRNLGAVTTDYSEFEPNQTHWTGLYYQFGRKDPIFRATIDPAYNNVEVEKTAVSVAYAHRHPTTYFYDESSNNWTSDENSAYFWGNVSVRDDAQKTLYDPCPPGYRVPGNALWQNPSSEMTSTAVYNGSSTFAGYEFNLSNQITVYYPVADCIIDGVMHDTDLVRNSTGTDYVFLYSSSPYDPSLYGNSGSDYENLSHHFRYNEDALGTNYSDVLEVDPSEIYSKRSAAFPVRCVLENSAPVVTDLSESQTANSYVVSKSGFYKFKANVRGNGVTALNIMSNGNFFYRAFDDNMGSSINVSEIAKVDLLWWQGDLSVGSDYRTFAEDDSHTSDEIAAKCPVTMLDGGLVDDEGYALIYVNVNSDTYGNVGLAAYDEDGEILWSWHIWIQPGIYVKQLGDYTVMDRNLGATYSPADPDNFTEGNQSACAGFNYQWGRKDPFFGPNYSLAGIGYDNYSTTTTLPWYKKGTDGTWTRHTENLTVTKGTISESASKPLYMFTNNGLSYSSDEPVEQTMWQTSYTEITGAANDLWGYVGSAGFQGNSFAKTMYDPCPPGYRVMQHNVFESAGICDAEYSNWYQITPVDTGSNWGEAASDYGIYFVSGMYSYRNETYTPISAGGVWFPLSATSDQWGSFAIRNEKVMARLSTSTPYADLKNSYLRTREIRFYRYEDTQPYQVHEEHYATWMIGGRVVRCQME